MVTIIKRFASIPGSPTKGEDRVKITSAFGATQVYVARLVKSSGRFSSRRYLIDRASIREEREEIHRPAPEQKPAPVASQADGQVPS